MSRLAPLATGIIACAALVAVPFAKSNPIVVWNASPSVPMGLYIIERRQPGLGEVAVLWPPNWASAIAVHRHYLPSSALLLKPVAAGKNDVICRFGPYIFVNGLLRATALSYDRMKRPMPVWKDCLTLSTGQVFVLSKRKDSFDSRYFGVVEERQVQGTGRLIFSIR